MTLIPIDVKLETAGGHHVGWSKILPFNKPPDVLIWGERVFRGAVSYAEDVGSPEPYLVYREAFTVAIVTPVTDDRQP